MRDLRQTGAGLPRTSQFTLKDLRPRANRQQLEADFRPGSTPDADTAFRNARQHSDREKIRIEGDKVLIRVMNSVMKA